MRQRRIGGGDRFGPWPSMVKRRVAIYGGSFDPPHLGHVMVVTHLLLNDPEINHVLVVPCFQHKDKKLTHYDFRLKMTEAAFGWLPRTEVSDIERSLGGVSLTVNTVQHLSKVHPDWEFRLVMGADLMDYAPTWEGWDIISSLAPPILVGRAGISPVREGDPTPISPIVSSTIVRNALQRRSYEDAERYLPRAVIDIIRENDLYADKDPVAESLAL